MRRCALSILLLVSACSSPEEPSPPAPLTTLEPVFEQVASYIELNGSWPDRLDPLIGPDGMAGGLPLQSHILQPEAEAALRARGLLQLARTDTAHGEVAALTAEARTAWKLGAGPVLAFGLHEECSLVRGTRPAHLPRAPRDPNAQYPFFLFLVDLSGGDATWAGVLSPDGLQLIRPGS